MTKRAQFATRMGVIAATVGSAVGLGNIWRFPYEAGVHGGGAFLFIYLICVFIVGVPVILAEFVIGRSTHKNARGAFKVLDPHRYFRFVPYIGIVSSIMILSFYAVVAGWIIEYLYQSAVGSMSGHTAGEYATMFNEFTSSPTRSIIWTVIFLILNFLILRRGIEKGIEKISNIMMPILFVILLIFCINSISLPDAWKGVDFLFHPDFSKITPNVVLGALGQAFFSLSLGLTCLLTYSSYFSDKTPLVRSAVIIALLDTLVALLAGIIIFPAVFSFGMEPSAGPKLVFEILPNIFQQMPGGYFWSLAFFVLLFFASITSSISMSEISITFFSEEYKMGRQRATLLCMGIALFFATFCALSFGVLSDFHIFGMTVFNLFDYVSSNILLPLGGMAISIFVGWFMDKNIVVNQFTNFGDRRISLQRPIFFCIRYIAPICIGLIFLYGLGFLNFLF